MTIAITVALNESRLTGVLNFLNQGTDVAYLRLYGGTRAASVNDTPSTPLLAAIPLDDPSGTVGNNKLTLTAANQGQVQVSGVATWARLVNGDGATALDCDVSLPAGAGDVTIDDTTLWTGGFVSLVSAILV